MRLFKRRKPTEHKAPTLKEFVMFHHLCSDEIQQEDLEVLKKQPRPDTICGVDVPTNLNSLSYGQLDDLRNLKASSDEETIYALGRIIFGKTLDFLNEDVNKVFGFVNFCTSELTRINDIFLSIQVNHTPEERQAGVETLNFGSFGVLDWYAKRMGITNQNDVRDVAWVRIFQCMKNDHLQSEFEKRLQDIYLNKSKK